MTGFATKLRVDSVVNGRALLVIVIFAFRKYNFQPTDYKIKPIHLFILFFITLCILFKINSIVVKKLRRRKSDNNRIAQSKIKNDDLFIMESRRRREMSKRATNIQ
ncbi:hypothetical protein AFE_1573 [Acidithiobacillus ferrooxidans ATCC 23270]|uniref:Uncharacterized protein n=1 Tax=Acidithiobacillus ferrooxidans (strain ATCC 23270 / DSM 14882 / CIP 104768 / NCIMB 8455) TaxID=243159 RepID=B7JAE9_ACIF2|nr:hypothetical protein AFE_1573 [Acidithiobacillus ferrooxidans ATCC 23270]